MTTLQARLFAAVRASRLDAELAVGAAVAPGTALAVRATRLSTRRKREAMARTLCDAVSDSRDSTALRGLRNPVHRTNVAAARPVIDDVVARLRAPQPLGVRGLARLSRIVEDGTGPLYRFGRGDLVGRLQAARAAM
ncbi:hypothetical protein [Mycolicibacterium litorale]|uniref:Uncharacterized protein n=1 Tax=Mycolicibacterium litorale TaxID=758802 RepID=A0AAD1II99_9MYCO|nr:hypothetical protein [Mycolicibacterium litorale]MCV7414774.1 hypothetical protein [Mycolicibacterium litorale]TDY08019.1 hypothetical protein BCL50_0080 [Mycolicibacterium litorale]BBY15939.1 hypothetical protein MLIT_15310 [Mycolicibacterium litorale]